MTTTPVTEGAGRDVRPPPSEAGTVTMMTEGDACPFEYCPVGETSEVEESSPGITDAAEGPDGISTVRTV